MSRLQEVSDAILEMDSEEIKQVVDVINIQRERNSLIAKAQFRIGDRVKFFSRREQREVIGTVQKINRKKIVVTVGAISWTVPPTMLSITEGEE
tara:strand:- start:59 stop:340 length:282 start_codon:yes stop_codon:yes gene_type:complete